MKSKIQILLSILTSLPVWLMSFFILNCSTTPETPAFPDWIRQPTRVVDNGYIVYVESEDDRDLSRAKFKAESSALADLANECTLIPKGVRVEDRYDHAVGNMHQSYVKVGVELQECEEAKKAVTPEAIRKLANAAMTEQVKKYREMIGQPEDLIAENEEEGEELEAPTNPNAGTQVATGPRSDAQFYVMREQIFVAKSNVVLAPSTAYQPQAPETVALQQRVGTQSQQVAAYECTHPALKTSPRPWSYYRHQALRPRLAPGYNKDFKPRHPPQQPGQQPKGQGRRRRRQQG